MADTEVKDWGLCVGALPKDIGEDEVQKVFEKNGYEVESVTRGENHCLVHLSDPSRADEAVKEINKLKIKDSGAVVFKANHPILKVIVVKDGNDEKTVIEDALKGVDGVGVTRVLAVDANGVVRECQDADDGAKGQESSTNKTRRFRGGGEGSQRQHGFSRFLDNYYASIPDLPTRMVVPVRCTGAIIGKKGETIRGISQASKAQIHINLPMGPAPHDGETVVDISGSHLECGKAATDIMRIVEAELLAEAQEGADQPQQQQQENEKFQLRLLARRNYIGRLVGKDGRNLRQIESKAKAKVSINNRHGGRWMVYRAGDSVVTIGGEYEQCAAAAALVMKKLSNCYRNDLVSAWFQSPQAHPPIMNPVMPVNESHAIPVYHQDGYSSNSGSRSSMERMMPVGTGYAKPNWHPFLVNKAERFAGATDCCYLSIPKKFVGSVIGWKGFYIKRITWMSGTSIEIVNRKEEKVKSVVKIDGGLDNRCRAQYLIFERIKERASLNGKSFDLEFECEMAIPSSVVPVLVGKGNAYVKQLENYALCKVDVGGPGEMIRTDEERASVKIVGKFYNVLLVQRQILDFVSCFSTPKTTAADGKKVNFVSLP